MAETKKYYWLKLKRDFFKRHDIQIIESMTNGKDYILFYLKLLCESVDHNGNLRFSDRIPYSEQMLSTITNTNVDIVRSAIKVFTDLGMMEIQDDGTIFMNEVESMLGSETDWAKKKRLYRQKQGQLEDKERTLSDKSKSKSEEDFVQEFPSMSQREYLPPQGEMFKVEFEELWKKYPRKDGKKDAFRHYQAARRDGVTYQTISDGLDRYNNYLEKTNTNEQFINKGSSWFCGRHWDDEYKVPKKQLKPGEIDWENV